MGSDWHLVLHREGTVLGATVLVGNALRFVRHGSRIKPGGSITVRAGFDAGNSHLTITVQDDGAGIPFDKLRWLFNVGREAASRASSR